MKRPGDRRKIERRGKGRRRGERRKKKLPFGSRDWVEAIQQEYHLWPKKDRRRDERRNGDRRKDDRRKVDRRKARLGKRERHSFRKNIYELDREERQLLDELFMPRAVKERRKKKSEKNKLAS